MILGGEARELYHTRTFEARQHDPAYTGIQWSRACYFPPVYPPPHYGLATLVAWIPYRFATIAWSALLMASMGLGSWVTAKHLVRFQDFQGDALTRRVIERWSWIGIVLFPCSVYCFIVGQKGPFWLLIFAVTWALLRNKKDGWAGIVFGLLSIKPTLFFLLPLVMLRYGRWRFLFGATLTVAMLWGGAFALLPIEVWSGFAEKLRMSSSYTGIQGYHLDWSCSLNALSYVAIGERNIAVLKWFVVLPLSLYGLWVLVESQSLDVENPGILWCVLSATFLLSPHTYYYDLLILLIPVLWYLSIDLKRGLFYYAILTGAVVLAPVALQHLGIPLIPFVLVGILAEQQKKMRLVSKSALLDGIRCA